MFSGGVVEDSTSSVRVFLFGLQNSLGSFNLLLNSFLKGRQGISDISGVAESVGGGDHQFSGGSHAEFPPPISSQRGFPISLVIYPIDALTRSPNIHTASHESFQAPEIRKTNSTPSSIFE
ncbi:hypothetical protein EVAR_31682_1 [Eumeta japonica]|uniref:Uncharacterized protein n=1 Tax=Eumeta variegata TaxID=151549 RepID=A0A4C1VUQ8_EUMVA|nr:hypothetical protein EVAR_31682_1 [Eumeta japonica]